MRVGVNLVPAMTTTRESETTYGHGERPKVTSSQAAAEVLRKHWEDIDDVRGSIED